MNVCYLAKHNIDILKRNIDVFTVSYQLEAREKGCLLSVSRGRMWLAVCS